MVFRELRKKKNRISIERSKEILRKARRGVLALHGEMGYPYGLPINYYYDEIENAIYFHGTNVGYKIDCMKRNNKVCFTVIGEEVIREEAWAPYVASVILYGWCEIVEDRQAAAEIMRSIARKYYPSEDIVEKNMANAFESVTLFAIRIEYFTGKEVQES